MSWGLSDNCYGCPNAASCPDVKRIQQAVYDIHQDPQHSQIGGYGNITINCGKKETLIKEKQTISSADVGRAEDIL